MFSSEWNKSYIPAVSAITFGTKFYFPKDILDEKYHLVDAMFDITCYDLIYCKLKRCCSKIVSINRTNVVCKVLHCEETEQVYQSPVATFVKGIAETEKLGIPSL